jgi:hypothetical protein
VLYIKFEKRNQHTITITDLLGKTIVTSHNNLFNETIDISNWSSGMYICKVVEDGMVTNKKFIVRH